MRYSNILLVIKRTKKLKVKKNVSSLIIITPSRIVKKKVNFFHQYDFSAFT